MSNILQKNDQQNAIAEAAARKSVAESGHAMLLAKSYPRDVEVSRQRIMLACTRPRLAEHALYAYPKGGKSVEGPSIRLAEVMAQCWGNVDFGIRELSQDGQSSTIEAFAHDLETNSRSSKVFQVRYERRAGGRIKRITDPREQYEHVANMGARRLRAAILAIIPTDIAEEAAEVCRRVQAETHPADAESVAKMLQSFEAFGVSAEMVAERLGKSTESINSTDMVSLRSIYVSLRDGMSKPADFFAGAGSEPDTGAEDIEAAIMCRRRRFAEGDCPDSAPAESDSNGVSHPDPTQDTPENRTD